MLNRKRIVITGGAGFIGSSFIDRLRQQNIHEVLSLDFQKVENDFVISYVGNFGDKEKLNNILQEGDIVFHLGGSSIPAKSEKNILKDLNENAINTINLLDICVKKKINLLVFASSGGTIYGESKCVPIREEDETNPINFHGIMKLMIEKYIKLYSLRYGLNYVIMRGANIFGRTNEENRMQGVVDVFIKKALANEPIEVWGDGGVIRDYIYIDNVVDLMMKMIEKNVNNTTINIGSGIGHSLNEVISIIGEKVGNKMAVTYLPKRGFDVSCNVLDITRATELFDWRPQNDLGSGIENILKKLNYHKT